MSPKTDATTSEDSPEIPLGDLYIRRQSRKLGGPPAAPADAYTQASRMYSVDLERPQPVQYAKVQEQWQPIEFGAEMQDGSVRDALNLRRPDEAHLFPPRVAEGIESNAQAERDLEADVFLSPREKKDWAIVILAGSLSVCALCGLIAGLALT